MKYTFTALFVVVVFVLFQGCNNRPEINFNKIYSDKRILRKILNFTNFSPDSVRFKYRQVLNSIEGEQPSLLPTPKDYVLEAVLHFSPEQIKEIQYVADQIPNINQDFILPYIFAWIPEKDRLKKSDFLLAKEYKGSIFFPYGTAKMMINKNTVYLIALTH